MGSFDRFFSVYIEHTAGKFPIWLAPEQIRIITLNQDAEIVQFANDLAEKARDMGLRASVDSDNESVGKKIRNAELAKVPYAVVIGQKELETKELTARIRKDLTVNDDHPPHTIEEFLKTILNESKSRVMKTSL
jgi:threonyl-tRNA synthetase